MILRRGSDKRSPLACAILLASCAEGDVGSTQEGTADDVVEADEPKRAKSNEAEAGVPEVCPPSLAPLERPEIQPGNRFGEWVSFRRQIERVEVLDLGTYRVLFSMDEETVEALRQVPLGRRIHWSGHSVRPDSLPAWNVVLLVYMSGKELPYLGHFFDDAHLYFVDEEDPWDPSVYDEDMNLRGVYGIDTDLAVDGFLTARLGEHDPFGNLAREIQRAEDARCGRSVGAPAVVDHLSQVRRTPELCPHLFKPSLVPLEPPMIQPRNRAQAVQPIRQRIERVEVLDLSSYRILFTFDDATVEALRRTPEDEVISWIPNERPASLPAWEVGLLIYVAGEQLPYLGHYFDDMQLYFVDEADPWDPAVYEPGGEKMRNVYGIPVDYAVDELLVKRLGARDPFEKIEREARRAEDARCGRTSQPHGDPFPEFPKAIIEPASPPEQP